jgi:hypothetical protein
MQFGSYMDTCPTCRGHRVIEVLEERSFTGDWVRNDDAPWGVTEEDISKHMTELRNKMFKPGTFERAI